MSRSKLRIVEMGSRDDADVHVQNAYLTAHEQGYAAVSDLSRNEASFLHLPFPSLDALVGGIPKGEVWYGGGFSGDGKTAFATSLMRGLVNAGKRPYYIPTESPGKVIRTHLACKELGYDAGDFLSGAYKQWPNAADARIQVRDEIQKYIPTSPTQAHAFWVAESGFLSDTRLMAEAAYAAELGADVLITDHIDHCEGDGNSLYESSINANRALLDIGQKYGLTSFALTQFNLEAIKGNRIMRFLPPRENYVFMGNHKRQIADGMISFRRVLKLSNLDLDLVKKYKAGDPTVQRADILEPNTMCIDIMKHRKYGAREGMKTYLHVRKGCVEEFTGIDRGAMDHGIATTRRSYG